MSAEDSVPEEVQKLVDAVKSIWANDVGQLLAVGLIYNMIKGGELKDLESVKTYVTVEQARLETLIANRYTSVAHEGKIYPIE
jgi:hypothetical protein